LTAIVPLVLASAAALRTAAVLPDDDTPYLVLMAAGFIVGILGHVFRVRLMIAVGIAMIFLATLLLPIASNVFSDREEPSVPGAPA
jgi:uncharacterized membrane protein YGL010W